MRIVEDHEFPARRRGKYHGLYKEFTGLPHGTVVKFMEGEDFDTDPAKFAATLRTGLWNKGYRCRVALRGGGVCAVITGLRDGEAAA